MKIVMAHQTHANLTFVIVDRTKNAPEESIHVEKGIANALIKAFGIYSLLAAQSCSDTCDHRWQNRCALEQPPTVYFAPT